MECTFKFEEVLYFAFNAEWALFTSGEQKKYNLWTCQKVIEALVNLLYNIHIGVG